MTRTPLQQEPREAATTHPEVEFALVLARTIDSIKNDPEQMRSAVYELARQKLQKQFSYQDAAEIARLREALEIAIQGVETHSKKNELQQLALPSRSALDQLPPPQIAASGQSRSSLVTRYREPSTDDVSSMEFEDRPVRYVAPPLDAERVGEPAKFRTWRSATAWRYLAVSALFLVILIAVQQRLGPFTSSRKTSEAVAPTPGTDLQKAAPAVADQRAPVSSEPAPPVVSPLHPTSYGVYAVSAGKLYELEQLQISAPDLRVAISAAITTVSHTALPDGHLKFVVFQRDSGNSTPDQAEVRVIAKIAEAMTFDTAGKPIVSSADENWVIRNIVYRYRTAPIPGKPEMYEIQAKDPDAALTPGRYALAIQGRAYDFQIEGTVTDGKQCLARLSASNGTFYSDCQKPP
jgi:hypothetical protein